MLVIGSFKVLKKITAKNFILLFFDFSSTYEREHLETARMWAPWEVLDSSIEFLARHYFLL